MIAFQNIKSGEFLSTSDGFETMPLLCDAFPWHESDEAHLRLANPFLEDYRTVTFSTRIDHPMNNLAVLTAGPTGRTLSIKVTNTMNETTQETAHTPEPWNVEHPYDEPGVYISGPNTGLIAKLYTPDAHLINVDKPVSIEANARLIAAAPELLEELKRQADYLSSLAAQFAGYQYQEFRNELFGNEHSIRAAIAKAEGRA